MVEELSRRHHGVTAIRGDQSVGDGADPFAPPPGGLGVGGDADGPGDVCGIPITGLHQPVIVPCWKEHDVLGSRGVDDSAGVGADPGAACEDTEVKRLEVGELIVGPFDLEHDFPGGDGVAVVQGTDGEGAVVIAAELEDRDGLVDAAEERVGLAEHLHGDPRRVAILPQDIAGANEVFVGVIPRAHLLNWQIKDGGIESAEAGGGHCGEICPPTGRLSS